MNGQLEVRTGFIKMVLPQLHEAAELQRQRIVRINLQRLLNMFSCFGIMTVIQIFARLMGRSSGFMWREQLVCRYNRPWWWLQVQSALRHFCAVGLCSNQNSGGYYRSRK